MSEKLLKETIVWSFQGLLYAKRGKCASLRADKKKSGWACMTKVEPMRICAVKYCSSMWSATWALILNIKSSTTCNLRRPLREAAGEITIYVDKEYKISEELVISVTCCIVGCFSVLQQKWTKNFWYWCKIIYHLCDDQRFPVLSTTSQCETPRRFPLEKHLHQLFTLRT